MRKIRIISIIIFALAVASYIAVTLKHSRVDDNIAPRISMSADSIEVSVEDDEEALLQGVSATDSNDGDVSDTLIVESMGQFLSPGRRNITIAAFDSSSNMAKTTREITYSDYRSPKFSLDAPLRFPINTENLLEHISASDCLDGDLTQQIKLSNNIVIDTYVADNYEAAFTVTNTAGDTVKLPCTITIYDNSQTYGIPTIELSDYLVYVKAGEGLDPWKYVTGITRGNVHFERGEDGNFYAPDGMTTFTREEMSIRTKDVDLNTPGTYEYVYKVTDNNNRTGQVRLIVVVE